jgi:hypothetical protein
VEPLSLLIGGGLLAVGFLAGRLGRARQPARPSVMTATCTCKHPLSQHDSRSNTCYAEIPRDAYTKRGRWAGHTWVPCPCRQYVGPRPIDEVFVPPLLPPRD